MADKPKQPKRKRTEEHKVKKKIYEQARAKTRINVGEAFQRWRNLRELKDLKTDAELALFLLDLYDNQTATSASKPSPQPVSRVGFQSVSESISCDLNEDTLSADDFTEMRNATMDNLEDITWNPDEDKGDLSSLEEGVVDELGSITDSDVPDYTPHIHAQTDGALKTKISLDTLPEIGIGDTVHDCEDSEEDTATDVPTISDTIKDVCEDDIIGVPASDLIGVPASISYHSSLRQLVEYLHLPVSTCKTLDHKTGQYCGASKPFEALIQSKGTAATIEWMCPRGHIVWRWTSQPTLKYGMHIGDFLLSTNILLSGNNYAKIALLFKFMNMRMVSKQVFYRIQDNYCVDAIHDFWEIKRKEIINMPRTPAELESFHNHIQMYASKLFSFTPPVYNARVLLAGLDYNHHINRAPKIKEDGSLQYGKVYSNKSQRWRLQTIKEEKDYSYIRELQVSILHKRMSSDAGVPLKRKSRPVDTRLLGHLSDVPVPSNEDLLEDAVEQGNRELSDTELTIDCPHWDRDTVESCEMSCTALLQFFQSEVDPFLQNAEVNVRSCRNAVVGGSWLQQSCVRLHLWQTPGRLSLDMEGCGSKA